MIQYLCVLLLFSLCYPQNRLILLGSPYCKTSFQVDPGPQNFGGRPQHGPQYLPTLKSRNHDIYHVCRHSLKNPFRVDQNLLALEIT